MGLQQFNEVLPLLIQGQLLPADGTNQKVVVPPNLGNFRCDSIILTSTDAIDHDVAVYIDYSSPSTMLLGTVKVPASAGFISSVPAVDAIPLLSPTLKALFLGLAETLYLKADVAVVATKVISINVFGGFL
jgi:hypothetical protein